MNVAITGANGFVGRALTQKLQKLSIDVRPLSRSDNHNNFFVPNMELPDSNWKDCLSGIDCVVHCAAQAYPNKNLSKIQMKHVYEMVNFHGTIKLVNECIKSKVKKIIFLSSAKVYGSSYFSGSEIRVESKTSPVDDYSVSKLKAENALLELAYKNNLEIVIIRSPLIYGEGVHGNFKNLMKIVQAYPVLPFGGINNKRSLIYLGNLVDFVSRCIVNKELKKEIFLISDSFSISTSDLVFKISQFMKKKIILFKIHPSIIEYLCFISFKRSALESMFGSFEIDISYAHNKLDWVPPFSINYGLKKTVEYYLKQSAL